MNKNRTIAILGIRVILGLVFLMQGYGKIFTIGITNLYEMDFFSGTFSNLLPASIIKITAYYTSYIEFICGIMLVLGYKTTVALYALLSVLIIVAFGHGLADPIWDLSHVMYRLILTSAMLIAPIEWDKFSIDAFVKFRYSKKQQR